VKVGCEVSDLLKDDSLARMHLRVELGDRLDVVDPSTFLFGKTLHGASLMTELALRPDGRKAICVIAQPSFFERVL